MELTPSFNEKTQRNAGIHALPLVRVLAQLLLIMGVVKVFAIEDRVAFFDYFWPLLPSAFVVNALLPLQWRLPFFVATGIGLTLFIFGATSGIWFLLLAFSLIGICHLPLSFSVRVCILLAVSGGIAGIHVHWIPATDKIGVVIPALGAIFMFRLAVYLYDLQHEKKAVNIWQRLAYFFLLPNPIFTLFPVVDYKTFLKTYYNQQAAGVYQKGVLWIGRGVMHFILYRLVTNFFSPAASEVTSIGQLAVFIVSSYLIYLRMSGLFHVIAGILLLFGFNLPETHRFYLLASGFNDYWQRINIYWKDLMMKLVYYPVFTRTKGLGMTGGMMIATAAVFFITWITHAYQSFWMRTDASMPMLEDWDLFVVDALFWGTFGVLVIINSLFSLKRKPVAMSLGKKMRKWSTAAALRRALQIAAMFILMCLLWSMWQSPSLSGWLEVLAQAKNAPIAEVLWLLGIGALAIALGIGGQFLAHRGIEVLPEHPSDNRAMISIVMTMSGLLGFGLLQQSEGSRIDGKFAEVADAMRGIDVRPSAQINLERGYYEGLLSADDGYARLLRSRMFVEREKSERPDDFPNDEKWARTGDIRHKSYVPSATGITVGQPWQTNQWGIRDQEYTKDKPDDTYRIAMLGASYTMGRGVQEDKDFESQLEQLLNAPDTGTAQPVEILNFATTAYATVENTFVCEHVVPEFKPDALFFVAHGVDILRCSSKLVTFMTDPEVELTYDYFKQLKIKAGIDAALSQDENLRRIHPFGTEILQWCYQRMADACRANDITPVWVFLPTTKRIDRAAADISEMAPLAEKAGFKILVIEDPYRGRPFEEIVLSEWDAHPNTKAHRGIALQFLKSLHSQQQTLDLPLF
ncbi:MAG: hypothetical protein ACI9R3_006026 [Verrucomicrobiales bacterium]|jgi:hypothetical protein